MNYNLYETPNWFFEVAACISEYYLNSEDEVIENHNKFGIAREGMEKLFSNYKTYKKAVLNRILPIYNSYSSLEWLFKPVKYKIDMDENIGISIVSFWGDNPTTDLEDDFIHKMIVEFITRTISDIINDLYEEDIRIDGISDLLDILEKLDIDDDIMKMHLIRLYHTRYETTRNLWNMIHACVPVLKSHYHIIEDDVDIVLKALYHDKNLEGVLDLSARVKFKANLDCKLYPTVYGFNRFKWELQGEDNYSYIGIYFLKLLDLKEKNKINEGELIADLKALSDSTRLKIIHILLEKEMYLKELAEKLSLTPATVSHHINTLLKSDLISITVGDEDNRRIFYEVNRQKLIDIGESINRLSEIYGR